MVVQLICVSGLCVRVSTCKQAEENCRIRDWWPSQNVGSLTKTMSTVTWWNKFLYFMYQHKTILLKKWKHLKTSIVLTCVPPATGKHEQQEYQPFQRNPLYCHAEHTMLYELYKLVAHYHPSVSLFARTVLEVSTDYHSVISFVRYRVVLQRVITLFFPL